MILITQCTKGEVRIGAGDNARQHAGRLVEILLL